MGRGRAKAKQTKVARQLKYGGPTTDLERLQAELAGSSVSEEDDHDGFEDELEGDPYAKYVEADDEDTDSEGR
jgi:muconolactone delta-isomerase